MKEIGNRIRLARKTLGMTQSQLSLATGMLQKDISRIENGKLKFIPFPLLDGLCSLGIDLNWMISGIGENIFYKTEIMETNQPHHDKIVVLETENKMLKEQVEELKNEKKELLATFRSIRGGNLFM